MGLTAERKRVFDAVRDESRRFDLVPVVVDSVRTFAPWGKCRAIDGDRMWLADEYNHRTLLPDRSPQRPGLLGCGKCGRAADAFHQSGVVLVLASCVWVVDPDNDRVELRHVDCIVTIRGAVDSQSRSIHLKPDLVASPEPRLPGWVVASPDRLAMPRQASLSARASWSFLRFSS